MATHKIYQSMSEAKREKIRLRQHVTSRGVDKVKFTPTEAEVVVNRMNGRARSIPVSSYACGICGWMHVGTMSSKNYSRMIDQVVILESGERVEAEIRRENSGSYRARIEAIASRFKSAENRRLASIPTPKRKRVLP
jgi:hypothetical protein